MQSSQPNCNKCNMAAIKMPNKHPASLIIKKPLSPSPCLLPVSRGHVYLDRISAAILVKCGSSKGMGLKSKLEMCPKMSKAHWGQPLPFMSLTKGGVRVCQRCVVKP
ncbi:hypothetical protein CDAR_253311 [Caerostris darwini]|uniref:Uncharacterized protein n=1 Tax=Caerostris darwini TaxID=1538125 RepID=A0AAV4U8J2_9ARAC|nr:hypothetical protein CDAR_253311 [Caerostris darwini]